MQGKLGALKLENGTSSISEFVGLASKMYTLLLVDRHQHEHSHMKGKGVPSRVLETQAGHEAYKKMVVTPYRSTATFSRFQSKNHVIEKVTMEKKMLTAFNDKVFQFEQFKSRPLGHWRNKK